MGGRVGSRAGWQSGMVWRFGRLLVNMIMHQNLPASCCNLTGSDILCIIISAKFDVDLCVTFLNFQSDPKSNDLVNGITPQKLPCCSFTGMVSASKSLSAEGFFLGFFLLILHSSIKIP